jgi:hypothetical protein
VDAWFDVMTTLPGQRLEPLALAAGVELPLAAVCAWLSLHTQQLAERRLVLLLRRGRKPKHAAADRSHGQPAATVISGRNAPAGSPAPG